MVTYTPMQLQELTKHYQQDAKKEPIFRQGHVENPLTLIDEEIEELSM